MVRVAHIRLYFLHNRNRQFLSPSDSVPLYLMNNPPLPPSSFPVVAKVINEEGDKTRDAMGAVKDVAGALLTMRSYKKGTVL